MHSSSRLRSLAGLAVGAAIVAAACSSGARTAAPSGPSTAPFVFDTATTTTVGMANDPTLGDYLTGTDGMTVYVLTTDSPDKSSCTGECATTWPPVVVGSGGEITGPPEATYSFTAIARADATFQVAYNHRPLYYYSGDSAPGDTKGQGMDNSWFVALVSGSVPGTAATATPAAS
jgi:predicted lipoprotein with Yx(FWY)xxD motif